MYLLLLVCDSSQNDTQASSKAAQNLTLFKTNFSTDLMVAFEELEVRSGWKQLVPCTGNHELGYISP